MQAFASWQVLARRPDGSPVGPSGRHRLRLQEGPGGMRRLRPWALAVFAFLLMLAPTCEVLAANWHVAPEPLGDDGNSCQTEAAPCRTIQGALDKAAAHDTVYLAAGTYAGNVVITQPVHIIGAGREQTTVVPSIYNPDCGNGDNTTWMCPDGTASVVMSVRAPDVELAGFTIDGRNPALPGHANDVAARLGVITEIAGGPYTNFKVHDAAVRNTWLCGVCVLNNWSSFEFRDNLIEDINSDPGGWSTAIYARNSGGVISNNQVGRVGDSITVNGSLGSTIDHNTVDGARSGIHFDNSGAAGAGGGDVIEYNTVSCAGRTGSVGIHSFGPVTDVTVRENHIVACATGLAAYAGRVDHQSPLATTRFVHNHVDGTAALAAAGEDSTGALLTTSALGLGQYSARVELTGNTITGFDVGVVTQRGLYRSLTTDAHMNRIAGNDTAWRDDGDPVTGSNGTSDFSNNWWGCNGGPGSCTGTTGVIGTGATSPWLVMTVSASPEIITHSGSSAIEIDLTHDSTGAVAGTGFPDGTAIALTASDGSFDSDSPETGAGVAHATYSGLAAPSATITATLDEAHLDVVVGTTPAGITLDTSTLEAVYDGQAHAVTATTQPAGLSYVVSYDDGTGATPTPPAAAGTYAVVATITADCCDGTTSGVLTIHRATGSVTWDALDFIYDGTAQAPVAHMPEDLSATCTVTPSAVGPDVGSYPVSVTCVGAGHDAGGSGTATISPASATITLSNLEQAYDGLPKSVTAITDPPNVAVEVTYDGSPNPPSATGSYAVLATVTDPNHVGTASATLRIVAAKLSVSIDDARDHARYGQFVDYVITLHNAGDGIATDIGALFTLSAGFDGDYAQFACYGEGAGAACAQDAVNPLRFTVSVPPYRSLTWLVTVPVRMDAEDPGVELGVVVDGAKPVRDENTLVILRHGFDVPYGDGTQSPGGDARSDDTPR